MLGLLPHASHVSGGTFFAEHHSRVDEFLDPSYVELDEVSRYLSVSICASPSVCRVSRSLLRSLYRELLGAGCIVTVQYVPGVRSFAGRSDLH